jgi:flavin reductase (DIM6/NTAB) family NADH-FMN oxidoreductase RutF
MRIFSESLNAASAYKLLTGVVVPRPIAWVATLNEGGGVNLAPFSTFTFVSADPPMVGFNAGLRNGERKDTVRNILARREYVVHIVDENLVDPMHASAEDFPSEISEAEALGLETVASDIVSVPRLSASPIAAECVFDRTIEFGRSGAEFVVGEIKLFHIRDDLIENGKVDTLRLNPVGRLAGPVYGTIGTIIRKQASASYAHMV